MGLALVPMSKVPPTFTDMLPPTSINALSPLRLYVKVPFIVVVLATALLVSIVTVWLVAIVTALQLVGIKPVFQVLELDQFPVWTLFIAWHVLPVCQTIKFAG